MDRSLARAYKFFKDHSGYVVGKRAIGALQLAKAEIEAENRGWDVRWEPEQEAVEDFLGDHEFWCARARRNAAEKKTGSRGRTICQHEAYWAVVVDSEGNQLPASLGGILDPERDYMRVVAAELFSEILGSEENERTNEKECAAVMAL